MKMKIGRFEYEITKDDKFLDNGACVQLLTQSKEKKKQYDTTAPHPKLSHSLIAKIMKMKLIQHKPPPHLNNCKLFSIDVEEPDVNA